MKFNNRIVPFTTVILCEDKNFNDIVNQTVKWCSSDSFNPAGKAFVVNVETFTISMVNRLREKKIKPRKDFTKASLIYFILKIKPSLLVSLTKLTIARNILIFSRAGRKIYPKGLFSFFFSDSSCKLEDNPKLKTTVPYIFNNPGNQRFGYRSTEFRGIVTDKEDGGIEVSDIDDFQLDLGNIPLEIKGDILWVPRRTTTKTVWTDFIKITYFAFEEKCRISVHIKNENFKKAFSTVFFIKGRKQDMDKYLNFIETEDLNAIVSDPAKHGIDNLEWVIFSFGLTTEYKKIGTVLNSKQENNIKLTTIKKVGSV